MEKVENVKNIMKEYNENIKKIFKELDNLEAEERRTNNNVLKLKEKLENLDTENMDYAEISATVAIYKESIKEAENKNKVAVENKNQYLANNEKVNKQKIIDNEDQTRKRLTQAKIKLESNLEETKMMLNVELWNIKNFKYEYEEKDGVKIPTNGAELKKLSDNYNKLLEDKNKIDKDIKYCNKQLDMFKEKDEKRVEKINKIIKEGREETKTPQGQQAPPQQSPFISIEEELKQRLEKDFFNEKDTNLRFNNVKKFLDDFEGALKEKIEEYMNTIPNASELKTNDHNHISQKGFDYIWTKFLEEKGLSNMIIKIDINEKEGTVKYCYANGDWKDEDLKNIYCKQNKIDKREIYDRVKKLCAEKGGSRFLNGKLNKAIIEGFVNEKDGVYELDEEQLSLYIERISNEEKLDFDLVHNVSDLGFWQRFSLRKILKKEEKSNATIIGGKKFDKNKALKEKNEATTGKRKLKNIPKTIGEGFKYVGIGIKNLGNHIAKNPKITKNSARNVFANKLRADKTTMENLDNVVETLANNVNEIMNEEENENSLE